MTDYYELLNARSRCGVDSIAEDQFEMFELFCRFLDATGEEWSLDQLKTKFSYDDLRFYVTGSKQIQDLARALESYWYTKYHKGGND